MKRLTSLLSVCLLLAFMAPNAQAAKEQICNNTRGQSTGSFYVSAWTQQFSGWHCRTWDRSSWRQMDYFWVNVKQDNTSNSSGYDAGVGRNQPTGKRVNDMLKNSDLNKQMGYRVAITIDNIDSNAYWWVGPKTIISSTSSYSGLDGEYECYIVDSSNLDRKTLARRLGGMTWRGSTGMNGSRYHHYTKKLGQINQVWSIRNAYRRSGPQSINKIQKAWKDFGLVPGQHYNLGWKINVETSGKIEGAFGFTYLSLPWL